MKKNSPRKKNVSKKRNTPKKKSYPEVNYVTETGASKKINKKRYVKKKKNKVDFIEYLRDIAKDVWDARGSIITVVVILGFFASLHFMTSYNPGNESAICTVTSVEFIVTGMEGLVRPIFLARLKVLEVFADGDTIRGFA